MFLSYHTEVEGFVVTVVKEYLESRGYRVCWHHLHFAPGRPIVDNIQHCVGSSRKVVLIISSNFVNSSHCMTELRYSLHRLQRTATSCILPIALDSGIPREIKDSITYWPFFDTSNTDTFQQQLLKYIGEHTLAKRHGYCVFTGRSITTNV